MKVMAIPDLHAWPTTYTRPGEKYRRDEWLEVTSQLVDLAVQEAVDLAVAPGDFFINARPHAQAVIDVNNFFERLESKGIRVIGCNGNHDHPGMGAGPVDLLASLSKPEWGITEPKLVEVASSPTAEEGDMAHVIVLPWMRSVSREQLMATINDLLNQSYEKDDSAFRILIGHWAIYGCVTSTGVSITEGETTLLANELEDLGFDAIILGHIHKPQEFSKTIPFFHTGSLLYNGFHEEHDERQVAIVDLRKRSVTWHPLNARKLYTWRIPESELLNNPVPPKEVEGAICRIMYTATEEVHEQVNQGALVDAVMAAGAYHCAGVMPSVLRPARARVEGLNEQTSILEALKMWLDINKQDMSEKEKEAVLRLASSFFANVENPIVE